jgi:polyisoprenoid-binding protein YceI
VLVGIWQLAATAAIGVVAVVAAYLALAQDWVAQDLRRAIRRRATWLVGLPVLAVVFGIGVPYAYLHVGLTSPPAAMTFADLPDLPTTTVAPSSSTTVATAGGGVRPADPALLAGGTTTSAVPSTTATTPAATAVTPATPTSSTVATGPLDGPWKVGPGTQARYGIDDTVLGQTQRVVGSTTAVTGSMAVAGGRVTTVQVVVDMRSVRCGCVHDQKYLDLLDTDRFPTSTFVLTTPIDLGALPAEGAVVKVPVTGRFTIHGVTRSQSFTLQAVRQPGRIAVNGSIPIHLEDYGIERPDAGAFGGISNATIDLLVAFVR